ncbi:hypothetical protein BDN71DRAFT_1443575 [Pleurotus eryngii]|uniref:Uncharacterized protein n=1 Tax=Pleurotus eryngii TaxID=5323 RepID=A0A9P6DIS2_PLEER|nr:hypothetical protein BDN71DRAFT_1443575 [Pleurotus eryngii]
MSSLEALPPIDKLSLITIWIETFLCGINTIAFFGTVYVLAFKRLHRPASYRYLLLTSTLLYCLSTAHAATSLRQLLVAFVDGPNVNVPGATTLYFLSQTDPIAYTKLVLYSFTSFVQDLVLIWRLYIVFGGNWKIAILPFAMEITHIILALIGSTQYFRGADVQSESNKSVGAASWCTDLIINVVVTIVIAGRLWWAGRRSSGLQDGKNAYMGVIWIIIESGAMFATGTFIVVVLYLNPSTTVYSVVGINIIVQLGTLTPLLIVVRVGLGITHGGPNTTRYGTSSTSAPSSVGPVQFRADRSSTMPMGLITVTQTSHTDVDSVKGNGCYINKDNKASHLYVE